jgi:DNA-binding Xre family transcriptional regulator
MKKSKKEGDSVNWKWFIEVFFLTFIISIAMSYISTNGVEKLSLIPAILILILVIFIGVVFDIIAIAVTVANEHEFHAKATKKVEGSKSSLKLIKNSAKVSNICADVIGDICGVLSGTISALIAFKLSSDSNTVMQIFITALVSALTVGGKAIGKEIANRESTKIVHAVGIIIGKVSK